MAHLIDELRTARSLLLPAGFQDPGWVPDVLGRAIPIVADEVAELFYTSRRDPWDHADFPNLAPPFELFWVEFARPRADPTDHGRGRGGQLAADEWPTRTGVLFLVASDAGPLTRAGEPRWVVHALLFVKEGRGALAGPLVGCELHVHPDGGLAGPSRLRLFGARDPMALAGTEAGHVFGQYASLFGPAFLAVSMLHCRNVSLAEVEPPPKLSRAHRRRHGLPLLRYHVLDIQPMRAVLRSEGRVERVGLRRALHLCRAHFAAYGPEYGRGRLFGRNSGRYFVPAHVRGAIDEGAIAKQYVVRAPDATGSAGPAAEERRGT